MSAAVCLHPAANVGKVWGSESLFPTLQQTKWPAKVWGTIMGKSSAVAVKAALANPGTYQDGDGLFLKVGKSGAASWLVRLQQDGRRRDIGLGSAKLLTLAGKRARRRWTCAKPCCGKSATCWLNAKDGGRRKGDFLCGAARQYHTENEAGWKKRRLCLPVARQSGKLRIPEAGRHSDWRGITAADIISVLTPIWQEIRNSSPSTESDLRSAGLCTRHGMAL